MTFIHPSFLWAAVMISVPLVLHFMLRRKVVVVNFSSLRLLGLLSKQSTSNLRLNQWLLLLLRILIVLTIVLLFSQPLFKGAWEWLNPSPEKIVCFLDNSYTMALTSDGESMYTNACTRLLADLGLVDSRTLITVVSLAPEARIVASSEAGAFNEQSLPQIHYSSPDLKGALLIGEDLIAQGGTTPSFRIYSAFSERSWNHSLDGVSSLKGQVTVVPFSPEQYCNWAISSVTVPEGKIIAGRNSVLRVRLTWAASQVNVQPVQVSVKDVEGTLLASRTVSGADSSAPYGTKSIELPLKLQQEGIHQLFVDIDSATDAIDLDNSFSIAVNVVSERTVMIFNGAPESYAVNDECFFLRHVYPGDSGTMNALEYTAKALPGLAEMLRADIIHLTGFPVVSQGFADDLLRFVKHGGVLVHWAGKTVNPDTLNTYLLSRMFQWKVTKSVSVGATSWLSLDDTSSAAGQIFSSAYIKELASSTYFLMDTTGDSVSERSLEGDVQSIPVRFDDDTPALILQKKGKGYFVFVNTTADSDWSNFPYHPVYPAFCASLSGMASTGIDFLSPGELFVAQIPPQSRAKSVAEILTPSGEKVLLKPDFFHNSLVYTFSNTWLPGLYRFSDENSTTTGARHFVVNPHERIHSLAFIGEDRLAKGPVIIDGSKSATGNESKVNTRGLHVPGTSMILLILLSFLLASESFVLHRIEEKVMAKEDD